MTTQSVLKNPSIRIDARGVEAEFRGKPVTDAKAVNSVVEKFREKVSRREEVLLEIRCGGRG